MWVIILCETKAVGNLGGIDAAGDRTPHFDNHSQTLDIHTLTTAIIKIDTTVARIHTIIELCPACDRGNYR
ncbi:hypothetical protein [Microcoleus sp. bin38.metabat.b11b12b14.051]|uniref:hypothetical protein n=1 Tax=Microcoleus sp. bin38.metabat.b11b12b14.051 TaxID=2742709 RepID=UPI0025F8D858|nr:hypothetical protein [Microcoleus sp. bin38.metabat.b11b12b14.051]